MGRRGYPGEFRRKVLDLLADGKSVASITHDLDISDQTIYTWRWPKRQYAAIEVIAADNLPVQVACKVVGVSESGYYESLKRAPSERSIRHVMLTDLITQIHLDSPRNLRRTAHPCRANPGRGVIVGHNQVQLLMRRAGLAGITGRRKWKRIRTDDAATDLLAPRRGLVD